jgi:hypothetical protein
MKKFLLTFLIAFMATISYAQVDTMYVKPGDKLNFELKVNTDKYPVLVGLEDQVQWYFGNTDNPEQATNFEPELFNGKLYVDKAAAAESDEGAYFYGFKIGVVTKTGVPSDYTCDTVKYVHVYKQPVIKQYTINDSKTNAEVYEGDTAHIKIKVENIMDAKEVLLLNGEDTIARPNSLNFDFIPSKEGKHEYSVMVRNPQGYAVNVDPRTITLIPSIKLESLAYFTQTGEDNYTKTTPNDNMNVSVLNHDSINLIVNTNAEAIKDISESKVISYAWNKEGLDLPKGIEVKDNKLIISEYDKESMDGKYNCIISDEKTVFTVTFDVTSEYPTSNSTVSTDDIKAIGINSGVNIIGAEGKQVIISDILGRVLYNKICGSDSQQIPIAKGVILVTVDGKTHKVVVK